jgi:hypothetical protein
MFAEAIRMVQDYSYATLCQQLIASNKVIGSIPRSQFDRWDSKWQSFKAMSVTEGTLEMKKFAAEVIGKAVHRMVHGNSSMPTGAEESKLFALLAPEEVNPYLNEFMLDSNTELAEVMAHYQQLTGKV